MLHGMWVSAAVVCEGFLSRDPSGSVVASPVPPITSRT